MTEQGANSGVVRLGIDIGGSGIKGAPVDVRTGELVAERYRVKTPHPATVDAVAAVVAEVAAHFGAGAGARGPVGVTFPGVVIDGTVHTAVNLDPSWLGVNAAELFGRAVGRPVTVLNDADAAGVAEMAVGAGVGASGVTIVLTFGTGIGSALFLDGRLLPNTELGHLEIRGKEAEHRASALVRETKGLSWHDWADRVEEYLQHLEMLFSPDLVIIGGGVSAEADRFLPRLATRARLVPASLANQAGIVGAAMTVRAG